MPYSAFTRPQLDLFMDPAFQASVSLNAAGLAQQLLALAGQAGQATMPSPAPMSRYLPIAPYVVTWKVRTASQG